MNLLRRKWVCIGVAAACLLAANCLADNRYDIVTFEDDFLDGWGNVAGGDAEATDPQVREDSGNKYLSFMFPIVGVPAYQEDSLYNDTWKYSGQFIENGAYVVHGLQFDFLGYPQALGQSLFFESDIGSVYRWVGDIGSSSHSWETKSFTFTDPSLWELDPASTSEGFHAALAHVKLIGITVSHWNLGSTFEYGIDNWQFFVPEPGVVAMSVTALLSMMTCFLPRRKRDNPAAVDRA